MENIISFVLKVASRCNLNCSYCYMYNLGDKTYLSQPKFMSIETIIVFAEKLNDYCQKNNSKFVQIVFHGGEPLLWSKDHYRQAIQIFTSTIKNVKFDFALQSNGVSLDDEWYTLFQELNIRVGISMDGPKKHHDRYRVFHNGKGSYEQVIKAIDRGKQYGMNNILSVVNLDISPAEFYQEVKNTGIPGFNILLPDGHYDNLPENVEKQRINTLHYTPYADWLIEMFELWKNDSDRPVIRFFQTIIELIMGEQTGDQMLGRLKNGVAVLETNGNLEVSDSIRACYEGITRNDINIHTHAIEALHEDRLFDVFFNSHNMVNDKCLNCSIYDICGGGFLGNRYSNDKGFDNPTIYCHDMIKLVSHIQNDIINSLPEEVYASLDASEANYEEIVDEINEEVVVKTDGEIRNKLKSFSLVC
ncbi:MAG: radical SAM protein [Chryseobacterium sp.]|uniref:radical SAM protein n=1 Tax=Chryseobacterium sp. TaxID=1871047 RepID=UPI0025C54C7C|nr:radical SAM protein [Chryseobacterium sp.]MCJ7934897.1 radical SAM protein [Chryseobacterium sp.]